MNGKNVDVDLTGLLAVIHDLPYPVSQSEITKWLRNLSIGSAWSFALGREIAHIRVELLRSVFVDPSGLLQPEKYLNDALLPLVVSVLSSLDKLRLGMGNSLISVWTSGESVDDIQVSEARYEMVTKLDVDCIMALPHLRIEKVTCEDDMRLFVRDGNKLEAELNRRMKRTM